MQRCKFEDDWVRCVVQCALQEHKNIIPVMLADFDWLDPMPEGMGERPNYQAIKAMTYEYIDSAKELVKPPKNLSHLKQSIINKLQVIVAAITAALTALGTTSLKGRNARSKKSFSLFFVGEGFFCTFAGHKRK